ncbi:SNF2 domain-containing protein CLASSY 4 [Bienertia sinuspersici]
MEFLPVGKRTRSQKAKMLKEEIKRARLAARRKWIERNEKSFESDNGGKKAETLMEEEEDYSAMVIDEEEFLKAINKNNNGGSEKPCEIQEMDTVKKEVLDYDDDDDDDHDDENSLLVDKREKGVLIKDINGHASDDSVQIIGEEWNPLGVEMSFDSDDEIKKAENSGEKDHLAIQVSSSDSEVSSSHEDDFLFVKDSIENDDYDDDDDDDDFEHSSSDISVEGEEDDEDEVRHERNKETSSCGGDDNDDVILIEDDDVVVSKHHDDNDDDKVRRKKRKERTPEVVIESNGEKKRKRKRPTKSKDEVVELESAPSRKKRVKKSSRNKDIQNTLLDTILEERNEGLEDINSCSSKFYLPLKFKFGVDKEIVHEKTEHELEVDNLFEELDFALQAFNIGVDHSHVYDIGGDTEDSPSSGAISQENLCGKGKHCLIHDDEIGVICKFCSYVDLEIKYVTPDFNKDPFGRGNRRDYGRFLFEDKMSCEGFGFQFPAFSYDHQGDCPSPSDDVHGTVWDLIPGVKKTLYPHQRDGFEFIWKNIAGGIIIDELAKLTPIGLGGCIICHAPGTGKTRLATAFLQSFMKQYQKANPLIVVPFSMLRTWEEEFAKWNTDIPFFNLNENELSGKEDSNILNYAANIKDTKTIRSIKLLTWASGKGVLAISYPLLQRLAGETKKSKTDEKVRDILLKKPGVLLLDEGHTPRNDKSNIWRVLSQISTKKRIILSGTPFQNNFEELHNTIALVREEFRAPVLSGYYLQDDKKIQELRNKIKPFVHIHEGEILKKTLKGLFHSLVILKPSLLQKQCFQLLARIKLNPLDFDCLVSTTSVHPSIFCEKKLGFVDRAFLDELKKHRTDLDAGVKIRFLVELIKLCKGERVLVFGQFLPPLEFIAGLLKSVFCWTMGRELLYMRGNQNPKERQSTIRHFNDPTSEAQVLLASTKACCEGIHLVGASRVVLLDVVWNPSVERQAISRAYRLGQQKDVFVYHLITSGTLEEDKYKRQATKERISELMFSSSEKKGASSRVSEDRVLEEMILHKNIKNMFEKII